MRAYKKRNNRFLNDLKWDEELCDIFEIPVTCLPEVCDSDSCFGMTDFDGLLPNPVPIHGVMGDSHAALFGQGCVQPGMIKATYGTGSSVMMNTGAVPVQSKSGVVTSLAWKLGGEVNYVLEGNINYTGAAITWLKDEVRLIDSASETESLSRAAIQDDSLYFIPAFTGLGAPPLEQQGKGNPMWDYENDATGRDCSGGSGKHCISDSGYCRNLREGCGKSSQRTPCGRRPNQECISDAVSERYFGYEGECV